MEEVDFSNWMSEWEVVVGAVFFFGWGCIFICIVVPMQVCIGSLCCGSAFYFSQGSAPRENAGFVALVTFGSLFLMIYGTLKHSPALAVVLIMTQSLLGASLEAVSQMMFDHKKLPKVQQNWQKIQKELQKELKKDKPDIGKILPRSKNRPQKDNNFTEQKVDGNEEPKELQPVSAYSDFEGCGLLECTLVFAVQMMLYAVLIASVWVKERFIPEEATDQEEMKFVGGAVIATLMGIRGENFSKNEAVPFWGDYFRKGYRKDGHWARVRIFMSWLVNSVFASAIVLILPIVLMDSEDGVEFVKDATSVMFIAELDTVSTTLFSKPLLPSLPENEVSKNDLHGVLPNVKEAEDGEDDEEPGSASENQSGAGEGDTARPKPFPSDLPLPNVHVPDPTCELVLRDNTPILE